MREYIAKDTDLTFFLNLNALKAKIYAKLLSLMDNNHMSKNNGKIISFYVWYIIFRLFKIEPLLPLVLDPNIQEIYIQLNHKIYVDHLFYGRILTNIYADKNLVDRLIFFLKLFSDLVLIGENPSAKIDVTIFDIKLRISIDISREIIFIDIRKAESILPILHMLATKTFNPHAISLLSLAVILRPNILIFGETGSGKTTFAKYLLSLLPSNWRLALVEDTLEIPLEVLRCKYIRINVDPYEKRILSTLEQLGNIKKKSVEILKLLHRMPDYIFVNEIQDRDDLWALLMAFNSGLRGIATIHAINLKNLLNRLCELYNVAPKLIYTFEILIEMKRYLKSDGIYRGLYRIYIPIISTHRKILEKFLEHSNLETFTWYCAQAKIDYLVIDPKFLSISNATSLIEIIIKALIGDKKFNVEVGEFASQHLRQIINVIEKFRIDYSYRRESMSMPSSPLSEALNFIGSIRTIIDAFYENLQKILPIA